MSEREDIESKLLQIQKWIMKNTVVLTKNSFSIVFAFTEQSEHRVNATIGGKTLDLIATAHGIQDELLAGADTRRELDKLFDLMTEPIYESYEKAAKEMKEK